MKRIALTLILLFAGLLIPAPSTAAAQPIIWVFGHSIPAGVGTTNGGWPARYAQLTGAQVRVFAVGGAVLDRIAGQDASLISDQVAGALAQYPNEVPAKVFVDAGTNDLVTHGDLTPVFWAVIGVDLSLQSRGVHGTWMTILPMGYGSSHPDNWVGTLTTRANGYNTWLRAMAAGGAFGTADMAGVLHEGGDGVITAPWLEPDGLHPSSDGALLLADRLTR